ncbi:MAG: dihydroorotate dehydrogenase electron transfer subunit [Euryarchaeota archaeon]|nr:dihydroorotate dehydrogenase electron transfer subunit [Euryarchaeota archaeon]
MKAARVTDVLQESEHVWTVRFDLEGSALPGQFAMLWVPGGEEMPMGLSYIDWGSKGATFKVVGDGTMALSKLKPGACLGTKGPLGRGYAIKGADIIAIAGGTGIASLAPAIELAVSGGKRVTVVLGAKSAGEMLFEKRLKRLSVNLQLATDDGSLGKKGFATDIAQRLVEKGGYDQMLACGPEPMLARAARMAEEFGIESQCSVERHMKCGLGLCGACALGGARVCVEGPVFVGKALLSMPDFGKRRLAPSGKVISF